MYMLPSYADCKDVHDGDYRFNFLYAKYIKQHEELIKLFKNPKGNEYIIKDMFAYVTKDPQFWAVAKENLLQALAYGNNFFNVYGVMPQKLKTLIADGPKTKFQDKCMLMMKYGNLYEKHELQKFMHASKNICLFLNHKGNYFIYNHGQPKQNGFWHSNRPRFNAFFIDMVAVDNVIYLLTNNAKLVMLTKQNHEYKYNNKHLVLDKKIKRIECHNNKLFYYGENNYSKLKTSCVLEETHGWNLFSKSKKIIHCFDLYHDGGLFTYKSGESKSRRVLKNAGEIRNVCAGTSHCLVLTEGKEVWVFGRDKEGQLGRGLHQGRTLTDSYKGFYKINVKNICDIDAAGNVSFFIDNNLKVYMCGNNKYFIPTIIPFFKDKHIVEIKSTGDVNYFLTLEGDIYCSYGKTYKKIPGFNVWD